MKQIKHTERKLLCRDGPKLEMSNSTLTDHCESRTAMVTSLILLSDSLQTDPPKLRYSRPSRSPQDAT